MADLYWFYSDKPESTDIKQAEKILKQGLNIKNVEDKSEIQYRLNSLYEKIGNTAELKKIREEIKKTGHNNKNDIGYLTEVHEKTGRNSLYPYGSGKKYKKCCGG